MNCRTTTCLGRNVVSVLLINALPWACQPGNGNDSGPGLDSGSFPAELQWELLDDLPSVVRVTWQQHTTATTFLEFAPRGEDWSTSPPTRREAGQAEELLLGLPYATDFEFRLLEEGSEGLSRGETLQGRTGDFPPGLQVPQVSVSRPELWDTGFSWILAAITDGYDSWTIIFDRQARIVWALETPLLYTTLQSQTSRDGSEILVDHDSYWSVFDNGAASRVVRLKIDGTQVGVQATPGLHHPFTEIAGGTIVWGAFGDELETLEEVSLDGDQKTIWSCQELQDAAGLSDYCQSNTVFWNEADDTFLFSLYSTDSILEIDHGSGRLLRTFGHMEGAWSFDPGDSAFYWQHGGNFTQEGTLLTSTHTGPSTEEVAVREYRLDSGSSTLRQVWSHGVGLGQEASVLGEAQRLAGGNTLHNQGSGARLLEITPGGEMAWEVYWAEGTYLGRTTPLEDLYALAP